MRTLLMSALFACACTKSGEGREGRARHAGEVTRILLLTLLASCSSPRDTTPSFKRDIAPVLEEHCTTKDCHGAQPALDVSMDLRPAAAYRQLVNAPAEMGTTKLMRVKPRDPDNSMLVHKLTGRIGQREGKQMPIDGDTGEPLVPSPLPAEFVGTKLVPWIAAGAPNN